MIHACTSLTGQLRGVLQKFHDEKRESDMFTTELGTVQILRRFGVPTRSQQPLLLTQLNTIKSCAVRFCEFPINSIAGKRWRNSLCCLFSNHNQFPKLNVASIDTSQIEILSGKWGINLLPSRR